METKVIIYQDGSLPPSKVIAELEARGGKNTMNLDGNTKGSYYYVEDNGSINSTALKFHGRTELLFDWEDMSFYEKPNKKVVYNPSKMFGELNQMIDDSPIFSRMNDSITAPDGYELVDANGNVVEGPVRMRKKRWRPKVGEKFYDVSVTWEEATFYRFIVNGCALGHEDQIKESFSWFPDRASAQAFCDELNKAIEPIIQKRKEATK